MSYGNREEYGKVLYFDLNTKDEQNPHFKVGTKVDGQNVKLEPARFVEGYIKAIFLKNEPGYEAGTTEDRLYIHLVDGDELYILRVKFFVVGRSIMNSLASLCLYPQISARLKISLYSKKGDDGKLYPRAYVSYGPEALDWIMTPQEMKDLTEKVIDSKGKSVMVQGRQMIDTSRLDAKLKSLMEDVIKHIEGKIVIPGESVQNTTRIREGEGSTSESPVDQPAGYSKVEELDAPESDMPKQHNPFDDMEAAAGPEDDLPF